MRTPRKPAKRRASKRNPDGDAPPKKPPRRPAEQPRSLLDFQRMFPDEATCADYMERVRWPDGFAHAYPVITQRRRAPKRQHPFQTRGYVSV